MFRVFFWCPLLKRPVQKYLHNLSGNFMASFISKSKCSNLTTLLMKGWIWSSSWKRRRTRPSFPNENWRQWWPGGRICDDQAELWWDDLPPWVEATTLWIWPGKERSLWIRVRKTRSLWVWSWKKATIWLRIGKTRPLWLWSWKKAALRLWIGKEGAIWLWSREVIFKFVKEFDL